MYRTGSATCPNPVCRSTHEVEPDEDGVCLVETWRCQGATPDLCLTRMCSECLAKCSWCRLPMCEEHTCTLDGEKICQQCMAGALAEHGCSDLEAA